MHNPAHELIDCNPLGDGQSVHNEGSVLEDGRTSVPGGSPADIYHQQADDNDSEDDDSDADSDTETGSE
jgi:hypothetical protein